MKSDLNELIFYILMAVYVCLWQNTIDPKQVWHNKPKAAIYTAPSVQHRLSQELHS